MEPELCTVGVDLGGTKIGIGVIARDGVVLESIRLPTRETAELVIEDLIKVIEPLLQRPEYRISAIGVGTAGQIDPVDGTVIFAPNLHWKDVPLRTELTRTLGVPVTVLNDVRAATWGEWRYGAGQGCSDFCCLFLGTGVGGGVVAGGKLLAGSSNCAGELGHTTLVWKGRPCGCGHLGCLEAYVSGWGMAQTLREAVAVDPQRGSVLLSIAGGELNHLHGEHLAAALEKGDALAEEIFEQLVSALTAGCISFVNAFNPQRLLLGGGVVDGMPTLIPLVQEGIKRGALAAATVNFEVVGASLGASAPLIGAAAAALEEALS